MKVLDKSCDMREGRICPACLADMNGFLVRPYEDIKSASCDRCGKDKPVTIKCRWMPKRRKTDV